MFRNITVWGFILIFNLSAFSAPKYPFPQQAKYNYGIMPEDISHKHVQAVYDIWLNGYYEEKDNLARIKFDEPGNTVSEGIGYGMLIMVYMDNDKNNTQQKFDKLWNYYKRFSNGNGLMHWKISGFNGVNQSGAATDAELDVAVALIMAHKQWDDSRYLNDAKDLISKIYSHEVSGNVLIGGDSWGYNTYNPSYMSMVATQLFQSVDDNGSRWSSVQNNCYQLLQRSQHSTTGMWPNWCNESGNPGGGVGNFPQIYGFDACRTPWRLGWAYAWYGHSDAKTLCSKIVTWFKNNTNNSPAAIGQQYNLDGSINTSAGGNNDNIPTYLGPLTVGGMVDPSFQSWVNNGYTRLRAFGSRNDNYYNECLELLSMLLLTGNMPDFTSVEPKQSASLTLKVNPPEAGTVSPERGDYSTGEHVSISTQPSDPSKYTFIGWSGDYEGSNSNASVTVNYDMVITANYKDQSASDLVDDFEDGDDQTNMGCPWFTFTDSDVNGNSSIVPLSGKKDEPFEMTSGGYNSDFALKVEYTLDRGSYNYAPFVGVGFEMSDEEPTVDISMSTGISFAYKGSFGSNDTCALKCESDAVTEDGASYSYTLEPSRDWKEISITWDEFLQPEWVTNAVELDLTCIPKIQWQIHGASGASGEFWIDDIHIIGYEVPVKEVSVQPFKPLTAYNTIDCSRKGSSIIINYPTEHQGKVNISLYSLAGKLVRNLFNGALENGNHQLHFDIRNFGLSNNMYVLRMSDMSGTVSRRVILNR